MLYRLIHITRYRRKSIWMFFIFILNSGSPFDEIQTIESETYKIPLKCTLY